MTDPAGRCRARRDDGNGGAEPQERPGPARGTVPALTVPNRPIGCRSSSMYEQSGKF